MRASITTYATRVLGVEVASVDVPWTPQRSLAALVVSGVTRGRESRLRSLVGERVTVAMRGIAGTAEPARMQAVPVLRSVRRLAGGRLRLRLAGCRWRIWPPA